MKQGFLDMIRESSVEKVSDSVFFLIKPIWGSCVDFCNRRLKKNTLTKTDIKLNQIHPAYRFFAYYATKKIENRKKIIFIPNVILLLNLDMKLKFLY